MHGMGRCTLEGEAAVERIAAWTTLIRDALVERETRTDGFALRFENRDGVAAEVRRLADLESDCCSQLRFDVREDGPRVTMTVEGPWKETPWRMAMGTAASTS